MEYSTKAVAIQSVLAQTTLGLVVAQKSLEQAKRARGDLLNSFNPEVMIEFKGWTRGQFLPSYLPDAGTINRFVERVLIDLHKNFNMPVGILWDDLRDNWGIEECFNDAFLY